MMDDFAKLIEEPLRHQEQEIGGERLHDYRICAICLNYTPRATYGEHMVGHGYEVVNIA